jgi:hypothetical protein
MPVKSRQPSRDQNPAIKGSGAYMTNAPSNQIRQAFLSSNLVDGFEKVTISTAAKCGCGEQIKPHDHHWRDGVIEVVCSNCHRTFQSLELAPVEEDDEAEDSE